MLLLLLLLLLLLFSVHRLEHLQRVSAADAHAVLVLHPEGLSDGGDGGGDDDSSVSGLGGAVDGDDPGAAALKMQTIMALTAQLLGKKAAVVVQVGLTAWQSLRLRQLTEAVPIVGASGCVRTGWGIGG
jgi:hypothetical protein